MRLVPGPVEKIASRGPKSEERERLCKKPIKTKEREMIDVFYVVLI